MVYPFDAHIIHPYLEEFCFLPRSLMCSVKFSNGFGSTFCQVLSSAFFQKEAIRMGRYYGCSDALSMSQEMSASKKSKYQLFISVDIWVNEMKGKKKIRTGGKCCLSIRRRQTYWWASWKAAKVLMSTEMSSVKWTLSSSAPCCFEWEISSCPTLISREDWWGFLHEHACTSSTAIPLQQFALNRQDKVTCGLLSTDIPLCCEQAKRQSD